MTVPVTGITPVFGLEYLVEGEPAFHIRQKWARLAAAIEAAMVAGPASPPGASDLLAVSGRVSALEAPKPTARMTKAAGQTLATANQWVPITWDVTTEMLATASVGMRVAGTPTRLIAPRAGFYSLVTAANGVTNLQIRQNSGGSSAAGRMLDGFVATAATIGKCAADGVVAAAGDHFEVFALRTTAGDVGTLSGYTAHFSLRYSGPAS